MSMLNLPSVSNFAAFMLQSYTFFCLLDAQQGRKTTVLNKNNDTGLRGFAAKRRNYKPCIVIAKKRIAWNYPSQATGTLRTETEMVCHFFSNSQ
jgi:hypothetical protein